MKKKMEKKKRKIPASLFPDTSASSFLSNVEELTISELIELYAYAEAIVETVREPLIILDNNLRIKSANKAFYSTFKVSLKDTKGKYIFDVGNGQWNIPKLKKLLKTILPKNTFFEDFEIEHDFPLIGRKVMVLNARRVVLEGFNTELILLAIEDNTYRRDIEIKREEFISIASHELKTPITSTMAFMQILQKRLEKGMDSNSSHIFSRVVTTLNKLNTLIQDMLDVRVINSGHLALHKSTFYFDELVKDCIEMIKIIAPTHTVVLKGKIDKNVSADKERISQVITNLMTNAIKYSPNADKIVLILSSSSNSISLSVQDFGIGINSIDQENIFQPFYRAKNAILEGNTQSSMGLGLHIASEIIKRHTGKISVKSKKGEGSTFSFSLPIKG